MNLHKNTTDRAITRRRSLLRRSGAVTVEAALVLPILLIFILGTFEYGRYYMTVHLFTNAANVGAAYAAKHSSPIVISGTTYGSATSDVTNVVNQYLVGRSLTGQSITVFNSSSTGTNTGAWSGTEAGKYVCVQISGTYQFIVPALLGLPASTTLSFQSARRSEGN
ncbi:MAG: pilus assembly protein [Planctomycetia bacterium]|nr:pilus assembly protein [Planctomycetia bacterium]